MALTLIYFVRLAVLLSGVRVVDAIPKSVSGKILRRG